ncbi:MAG: ISAs1 family transposase, partial [Leptolyngbya sp.]
MSPSVPPTDSLLRHFEGLEDPRTPYLIEHRLVDMVALTICAVVCGAETWVDIEAYGQSKVDWLSTFLA